MSAFTVQARTFQHIIFTLVGRFSFSLPKLKDMEAAPKHSVSVRRYVGERVHFK
jgi:hypothetical protein